HGVLAELLRHEHASLALAQRCSGVAAPAPLFTSLLNYRYSGRHGGAARGGSSREGVRGIRIQERTNYPVALAVDDLGEEFSLVAQAVVPVEAEQVCRMMHTALERLVEALEVSPGQSVGSIDVLPEAERRQVVEAWNATEAAYPRDLCVHELFERQVERTPDAVAVVFEGERVSYAELNRRANRLAHHLRMKGVGPDARVAVCVERSLEMVVALLGVLKAGGAYVPLDPEYPYERLTYMLRDSAPVALLTQGALVDRLDGVEMPVLDLEGGAAAWARRPEHDPESGAGPQNLAYVIYTSGSTGRPKGVLVPHIGVVNRLVWMQNAYEMGADDRILQKTTFSFDVSVWEFFWPLMTGARLVMARPGGHQDPAYLAEVIRREEVSTIHFVPSMLQVFLDHLDDAQARGCASLRRIVCSGEAMARALVDRTHRQLPSARLHNLYGPTEAAVDVTAWECTREESEAAVPIGRPIANTGIYLLDVRGEPVPVGVAGELYIGGVQVARGYLNRAELTAERFVPDPFGKEPGGRLYRTGDLARWLPEGVIEYLGRNDAQVKVRGFRIELGEIEARLAEHPGVRAAVVVAREDAPGDRRLVAYYTGEELGAEALRSALGLRLPEYMVPAAYVRLEALPLTPNGKLDRRALPAPQWGGGEGYVAPRTATEEVLAGIWAEVLRLERVGVKENFFEVGG
ncbi:MAG TPA: amino acid adenylation domain-containing protein, partial [Longimicrobiaceae bacterium]|nr:amino acid adenylation domain-containing protein [Longimicrobiaceae bacterium]